MRLETFFNNFDLLADAPNGVKKLRELILQLAVQGKLVPQDSTDEPASVLLEKIKAERERLIKEKKIRNLKPLLPIETGEIPYELPSGWLWTRLGNLVVSYQDDIVDGPFGSNLKASEYVDQGTPIIRIQNIKRNIFINKNINFITQDKAKALSRHTYIKGDVVITKLGDPAGEACIIPDCLENGIIVADLIRLRLNKIFSEPSYVTYL